MDGEEKTDDVEASSFLTKSDNNFGQTPDSILFDHNSKTSDNIRFDNQAKTADNIKSEFTDELPLETHIDEDQSNEELGFVKDFAESDAVRINLFLFTSLIF
jgi:hypothetical protein